MTISQTEVVLEVGAKYTLEASILPAEMDTGVLWTSSDESVVTVTEDGWITAKGVGTADITATAKADTSKTAVCKVTVVNKGDGTPATSITLSAKVLDLGFGETKLLSVTVSPDNAVMPELTWSSDNDTVVKVNNGKVTGVKEGSATVTVSTVTGGLTDSCQVTVTRTGIEGDWQTDWNRYFITAKTISTYIHEAGGTGSIPQNRYSYTKSGNGTEGTVTVTLQSIWNNDDNKWYTVDEYFEAMIKQIQESMSSSLRSTVLPFAPSEEDIEIGLRNFIGMLESISVEMNMTFDKNNLTKANLDKPVPQDVQNLYMAYAKKMVSEQKEEMTKPRTYEYEVTDDPWNGTMIHFSSVYDTTKKWFEQTEGQFSNGSGVNFYLQGKYLSTWHESYETVIIFSSVTETELTERDSGKTWTALWDGNTLTLTDPNKVPYKLTWSGSPL